MRLTALQQICGADLSNDVGCGNTRRLVCWDDPREALKEAAAHSPDMIVTNCCQEEGTIYALEKVQRSGERFCFTDLLSPFADGSQRKKQAWTNNRR